LVDTIKTSGTALNETLASVLSYAKINQFERQQNKYRNRRPPDADWSLPNKVNLDLGPDTDYEGLYICTNIAMLCEEVAGVLEASESYDKSTDERRVTVVLDIDHEEHWNFYTEPGALRRILINIIGNALKYTDEGSVTITLAASKIDTSHGDHGPRRLITLSVKDTGKGMSRDFMDNHLFVPFTQEDTVSSRGVGLGMSIVKSLVSLLAGEIRVESQLGQGTEVTVTMPMRLFDSDHSDRSETEKPALDLKLCTDALRREHLSAVLFGFPNLVRRSLEKYLVEWFDCKILEAVEDAEPDVVLVDEGNEEVAKDLEKKAQRYGRLGVLLSIAMGLDTFSKSMRHIQGYTKWERVPRPLGPLNLGKALSACVEKLRYRSNEQQEEPNRTRQKHGTQVQEVHHAQDKEGNVGRGSLKPGRGSPNPSNEGLSTEVHTTSSNNLGIHLPRPENIVQESASSNRPLPTRSGSFNTDGCYNDSADPSTLRILVVEDNIINKKILGAFLKKYGCRDVTNAENGAVAVAAVEGCSQSFDVIFMGTLIIMFLALEAAHYFRRISLKCAIVGAKASYLSPAYADITTDLSMPVMDGFQATREIRRIESERVSSNSSPEPTNRSYIIALTGLASDRDHDDALAAGVDKFVTKPVQFDKITKVLKQREGAAYDATHAEGP
jgi:CheY-like chemotaxis protein